MAALTTDLRASDYEDGVYYPSGDGKPMAETPTHVKAMISLNQALDVWLPEHRPDAYMGIDMFWYWEKGNRKACRAPDVFVAFGIPDPEAERNSFRSWLEGGAIPAVIFEMASKGTWRDNKGKKKDQYETQGVKEYFIFDPRVEFLPAAVLGWRLQAGKYREIKADPETGMWSSETLQLWLEPQGLVLRLWDPATGSLLPLPNERVEAAEELAKSAEERAETAERSARENQKARRRAERQAEQEKKRADQLQQERERADAEVARLRQLLRDRESTSPNRAAE